MRFPVLAALVCIVAAGCGGDGGDVPLPASGTAYRSLTPRERLAAATTCRDRAVAAAGEPASGELAKVDPRALRTELDLALSLKAKRNHTFSRLCAKHLPYVTPGATVMFEGATDSGDAYTYQTRSDKPLTIRGRLSGAPRRAYVIARREYGTSRSFRAAVAADGRFTLPTVRLRKQANNSFIIAIQAPPHALRRLRFSAICLDCLATG